MNTGTLSLTSTGHIISSNIIIAAGAVFSDAGTISTTTNLTDNGTTNFTAASSTVATLNGSGTLNLNPTLLTVTNGGTFTGPINGTGTLVAAQHTHTERCDRQLLLTASQFATLNINGSVAATTAVTSLGSINVRANPGTTGPGADDDGLADNRPRRPGHAQFRPVTLQSHRAGTRLPYLPRLGLSPNSIAELTRQRFDRSQWFALDYHQRNRRRRQWRSMERHDRHHFLRRSHHT